MNTDTTNKPTKEKGEPRRAFSLEQEDLDAINEAGGTPVDPAVVKEPEEGATGLPPGIRMVNLGGGISALIRALGGKEGFDFQGVDPNVRKTVDRVQKAIVKREKKDGLTTDQALDAIGTIQARLVSKLIVEHHEHGCMTEADVREMTAGANKAITEQAIKMATAKIARMRAAEAAKKKD